MGDKVKCKPESELCTADAVEGARTMQGAVQAHVDATRVRILPKPDEESRHQHDRSAKYADKHRPRKIHVPGSPDGRVGRVSLFRRNANVQLRWRQDKKNRYDLVRARDFENPLAEALARAAEMNRAIEERGATRRAFQRATIREACQLFLAEREASPDCSGPTLRKYRAELARVVQFAETTKQGRRCRYVDQIDSEWCEQFCRWLDVQRPTPKGKHLGGDAPLG